MEISELVQAYLDRLPRPAVKPAKPYILGLIGNIGSGKSTLARLLVPQLPGTVHVQADSARYLLKEAGMPWGENVKQVIAGVVKHLIQSGYAVILDGGTAEAGERDRLAHFASELGAQLMFVRVRCETEVCAMRVRHKYDDPTWQSSFERFRVGDTEGMVANCHERAKIHHSLDSQDIVGLVAEVDANVAPEDLERQIPVVVERIAQALV